MKKESFSSVIRRLTDVVLREFEKAGERLTIEVLRRVLIKATKQAVRTDYLKVTLSVKMSPYVIGGDGCVRRRARKKGENPKRRNRRK